jgi:hypothetical protein
MSRGRVIWCRFSVNWISTGYIIGKIEFQQENQKMHFYHPPSRTYTFPITQLILNIKKNRTPRLTCALHFINATKKKRIRGKNLHCCLKLHRCSYIYFTTGTENIINNFLIHYIYISNIPIIVCHLPKLFNVVLKS